jgi:hypothetical protein
LTSVIRTTADTTAKNIDDDTNNVPAGQTVEEDGSSPFKRQKQTDRRSSTTSYWPYSPEAHHLFCLRRRGGTSAVGVTVCNESPQEAGERLIPVYKGEDSWQNVVIGRDVNNFCKKAEMFKIRQRATFFCRAYQLAQTKMNKWTWYKCYEQAYDELNALGMVQSTCYMTKASWNMLYRQLEGVSHPNPYVQCGKRPLARLLEVFPNAKDQIKAFAVKNLARLTKEGVHDFVLSTVIPKLTCSIWKSDIAASSALSSTTTTVLILSLSLSFFLIPVSNIPGSKLVQ